MANNSSKWQGSNITKFQTGRFKEDEGRAEESSECFNVTTGTPPFPVTTNCIIGHIENEELWQLRKCLVGVMDSICSVRNIHDKLLKWGLGDINVQRLGAKSFLLTIMDEDLAEMLEDVNWSYLKEIFSEVMPWSEKLIFKERATWLEIRGLPLHCWNGTSLRRIAESWGKFEALGANANHTLDCEKATVLISTDQVRRIEEIIKIEVGENLFPVYVREIGFADGTNYPLCNNWVEGMKVTEN
ncbi:hypothetical protein V6N13_129505 [Hibiscus sabdariffa]